jgi:hypothetical protein
MNATELQAALAMGNCLFSLATAHMIQVRSCSSSHSTGQPNDTYACKIGFTSVHTRQRCSQRSTRFHRGRFMETLGLAHGCC